MVRGEQRLSPARADALSDEVSGRDGGFLSRRIRSFACALAGLRHLIHEHNAWIHAAATVAVCAAGLGFGISAREWCWLIVAIAGVWVAEAFNTALEALADAVAPEPDPRVGRAKDIAAGAVLLAAAAAVGIGLVVLGPHLLSALAEI